MQSGYAKTAIVHLITVNFVYLFLSPLYFEVFSVIIFLHFLVFYRFGSRTVVRSADSNRRHMKARASHPHQRNQSPLHHSLHPRPIVNPQWSAAPAAQVPWTPDLPSGAQWTIHQSTTLWTATAVCREVATPQCPTVRVEDTLINNTVVIQQHITEEWTISIKCTSPQCPTRWWIPCPVYLILIVTRSPHTVHFRDHKH